MKKTPRVIAIIQSRMNSTRLPGKAMLPLSTHPLLYHVIERTKYIEDIDDIIVATGRDYSNRPIIDLAESLGVKTFIGSDDNVLERYVKAAELYNGKYIIRITGDNPLIDPSSTKQLIKKILLGNYDLIDTVGLPIGLGAEIVDIIALKHTLNNTQDPYHLEHVTSYIKKRHEFYRVKPLILASNPDMFKFRFTVDTKEDYIFMKSIYEKLYTGYPINFNSVIALLIKPSLV